MENIVAEYKRLRNVVCKINDNLIDILPRAAFKAIAKKLGVWHKGSLALAREEDMSIIMDCSIHDYFVDGRNTVDAYSLGYSPPPDSDQEIVLSSMQNSYYSIFQVIEIRKGIGVYVKDILSEKEYLLADIGFSQFPRPGIVIAARILFLENFIMTGGAAIPAIGDALENAGEFFDRLNIQPEIWLNLSPESKAKINIQLIKIFFDALSNADHVKCEDVPSGRRYKVGSPPPQPAIRNDERTGRNDPCPCGSGKKYKRCCG